MIGEMCRLKKCYCQGGEGATGLACPVHRSNLCATCDSRRGFVMAMQTSEDGLVVSQGFCQEKECSCTGGVAVNSIQCTADGHEHCARCFTDQGYHLVGQSCHLKQCFCTGGDAPEPAACVSDGMEQCVSCRGEEGLALVESNHNGVLIQTCKLKECICTGGEAVDSITCVATHTEHCSSCFEDQNYYRDGLACDYRVCKCPGGTAATGECAAHEKVQCAECNTEEGYMLIGEVCHRDCTCHGGDAVSSANCPVHGKVHCANCNLPGYALVDDACLLKHCECPNGTPVDSVNCAVDKQVQCAGCEGEAGYYLDGETCKLKECRCPGGEPVDSTTCANHGQVQCASCHALEFYALSGETCLLKKCNCDDGVAADAITCAENGQMQCASCSEGFSLVGFACIRGCVCLGGVPGEGCGAGEVRCDSCHDEYDLVGVDCILRECECANGDPVAPKQCSVRGENQCASCTEGFSLENEACAEKTCLCDYGVAAVGIDCPSSGESLCTECDDEHSLREDGSCLPITRINMRLSKPLHEDDGSMKENLLAAVSEFYGHPEEHIEVNHEPALLKGDAGFLQDGEGLEDAVHDHTILLFGLNQEQEADAADNLKDVLQEATKDSSTDVIWVGSASTPGSGGVSAWIPIVCVVGAVSFILLGWAFFHKGNLSRRRTTQQENRNSKSSDDHENEAVETVRSSQVFDELAPRGAINTDGEVHAANASEGYDVANA